MRRICALILSLVLLFSLGMPAHAAGGPVLTVSTAEGSAGETIALDISLNTNPGIAAISFQIVYDKTALTLTGSEYAGLTDWTVGVGAGEKAVWVNENGSTATGTILRLKFLVLDTAPQGKTEVTLSDLLLADANENLITGTVTAGGITVKCSHTPEVVPAVAATCTESGLTEGSRCAKCHEIITAQQEVPAKGHAVVIDEAVAPGCTEAGKTEGKHCSVCEAVLVAQDTIPATGHTAEADPAVEPGCTETGKTEGSHCSKCGDTITAQQEVPANGHTIETDAEIAPTCTETGKTAGTHCSVCKAVLTAQETIPATGHTDAIDEAIPATCTESGLTEGKHCGVCSTPLVAQELIPALGHSFKDGTCVRCGIPGSSVIAPEPELLLGGKSVTLTAELDAGTTDSTLVWEIIDGEAFATISQTGVLKTKTVTEEQIVTVRVTTADGEAKPAEIKVKLVPLATSMTILQGEATVTGKTIIYNLRDPAAGTLTFSAKILPSDAGRSAVWTCSDRSGAYCSWTDDGNGNVTVTPADTGKLGTVTLTATATDGSKKKAIVKVNFAGLLLPGELSIINLPEDGQLQGKQTLTLKTNLSELTGLSNKKVSWSLSEASLPYASITSAGKLTVKEVGNPVEIIVMVTSAADPSVTAQATIRLCPVEGKTTTSEVRIFDTEGNAVTNTTLPLDIGANGESLQLKAEAYPVAGTVLWKSSNVKVATVETLADGTAIVTGIKAGTVTITATADDGSKVSGSVKVTVKKAVYEVSVANGNCDLTGGKSVTLKASFGDEKPTNTKVIWSLRPEDAPYATISSKGVLKAAKVTGKHTVQVTVTSAENPEVYAVTEVTIYPAATAVIVTLEGKAVSGKLTHYLIDGNSLQLSATTSPDDAKDAVTWKSSSAKLATVDANGVVTFTGKTGTVKLTATAADGSGKKTVIAIVIK